MNRKQKLYEREWGGSNLFGLPCPMEGRESSMWNCDWEYENQETLRQWYEEKISGAHSFRGREVDDALDAGIVGEEFAEGFDVGAVAFDEVGAEEQKSRFEKLDKKLS